MKSLVWCVAFSSLVASANFASAAEPVQPSDSGYDWSGFYIGAYAGYGEGTSKTDVAATTHPNDPFYGVRLGFLYDLDSVVLGLEGDYAFADLDDDIFTPGVALTQDFDYMSAVRARVGLPFDRALLFASAGWGWADTEYSYLVLEEQKSVSGPTVGFGVQYAFSRHFIGRIDYNHFFFGNTTYDLETPVKVKNSLDEIKIGIDFLIN